MGTIIYFALLFAMLSLGRFIGDKLFSLIFNWAVRSQNTLLLRSFLSAPPLAFWERGLFTVLVMAVLFSLPAKTEIANLAVFLACGLIIALLETGFSILKGYWAVKDAGEGLTETEKRHYATQRVISEGVQALQEKDRQKENE